MNSFILFDVFSICFINLSIISCCDQQSCDSERMIVCIVLGPELVGFHQLIRRTDVLMLAFPEFSHSFFLENGHYNNISEIQYYFFRLLLEGKSIPNPRHLFSILIKIPISCNSSLLILWLPTT